MNKNCSKCDGSTCLPRKLYDCPVLDGTIQFCSEHMQHYEWDRKCWLCLGSGRADIFTIFWRYVRG